MKKTKKRRLSFKKIFFLLIIIFFAVSLLCFFNIFKDKNNVPTSQVEIVDSIDTFDYKLNDNETKYYNELFSSLKELLNNNNYNEQDYAVLISKLFLTDFYDLDSKVMKSDVGGTQFVYYDYRDDFELGAMDNVYKFVESNVYGDRKQDLPIVKKVDLVDISNADFIYGESNDNNAYYLNMKIEYEKNLGYPDEVLLVLIHNDDKLEVVKMETK